MQFANIQNESSLCTTTESKFLRKRKERLDGLSGKSMSTSLIGSQRKEARDSEMESETVAKATAFLL